MRIRRGLLSITCAVSVTGSTASFASEETTAHPPILSCHEIYLDDSNGVQEFIILCQIEDSGLPTPFEATSNQALSSDAVASAQIPSLDEPCGPSTLMAESRPSTVDQPGFVQASLP